MKKYTYVRMKYGELRLNYTFEGKGKATHRDVINDLAAKGFRFVGIVPVRSDSYGRIKEYDLVFEKEE